MCAFYTLVIAFYIAIALCTINRANRSYSVIQGYILNTKRIGTRLLELAVLLIALTAIYKTTSDETFRTLLYIIT